MTQEEMWKAVSENDASYDGVFSTRSNPPEFIAVPLVNPNVQDGKMSAFLMPRSKRELRAFALASGAEATCWTISL